MKTETCYWQHDWNVQMITTGEEIEHFKPDCQASAKLLKYDTVEGFIYCPYCKRKVELSEKFNERE